MKNPLSEKNPMFYLYAVIATICWGLAPLFAKAGVQGLSPMAALAVRTGVSALLVMGWATASGNLRNVGRIPLSGLLVLGSEAILATLLADWAYFNAVKLGSASLLTIIMSASPAVTILFGTVFLKEKVTFRRIAGFFLIFIGLVLAL